MNARELFWQLAEPLMAKKGVEESTMMGFPCLRINGNFFAMVDEKRDALIVKLSADRVTDVIDEGRNGWLAEPGSPEDLAHEILAALETERPHAIDAAARETGARLDWSRIAEAYLDHSRDASG